MKKSLLALALAGAFISVAQAQSSVTVFGSIDGGIRNLTNTNAAGESKLTMGSIGGYGADRIGFRGVEDLGGGMNAHFHLESGFNVGTGALDNTTNRLFNRTASVGVGGAWGRLDLGHQYSIAFHTIGLYEPFKITHFSYTGIVPGVRGAAGTAGAVTAAKRFGTFGGARFDNDIQYTGKFGPITARAEYALGEVAGNAGNGTAGAVGLSYANGPLALGGAYTKQKSNVQIAPAPASYQDNVQWTAGAAYKLGGFRLTTGYMDDKQETGTAIAATKARTGWVGVGYNFTPALSLTGAYYQTNYELTGVEGKKKLHMASLVYALSKRTSLYAEVDHTKFNGVAIGQISPAGQDRQTGVSVGVFHQF